MNDDRYDSITQPSRRHLLGLIGATAVFPLAGCLGDDDNGTPTPTPTPTPGTGPPTDDVPGEDFDDVPRYPGSVRTEFGGIEPRSFIEYLTEDSREDIAAFYESQLPDHSWSIQWSNPIHDNYWDMEAHKDDGTALQIWVGPSYFYEGYNFIWIHYYPPLPTPIPDEPPVDDVPGEDLDDVPRYPDSVRTEFEGSEFGDRYIHYLTEATLEDIVDFYETQLPNNGWSINFSEPGWGDYWIIDARKDGTWLDIDVGPSWRYAGYNEIWISYNPPPPQDP